MSHLTTVIDGLCFIRPLPPLRSTPNVEFNVVPVLDQLSAIDRVRHMPGAYSPSVAGSDLRPWYMHPDQEDNLLVCEGKRVVELYSKAHGRVETFEVTPNRLMQCKPNLSECRVIYEGPHIFGWPKDVFHRVYSPEGSFSINFARHYPGFDIATNFNIYELNTETGEHQVLREGHLDQPSNVVMGD